MKALLSLLIVFGLWTGPARADTRCLAQKLPGTQAQVAAGWEVSIVKESQRKRPGDGFRAVQKGSRKICEVDLPSWGESLFLVSDKSDLFIVEQGDASNTTLSWIRPSECRILKELNGSGRVEIGEKGVLFAGGQDGPEKIVSRTIPLHSNCLP